MKASIVVCTRNGGDRLKICLAHIERLEVEDELQVILIDNASDDDISMAILESYASQSIHKVVLLQTATPGNAAGRNAAYEHISGDIVVFIDDDCYAANNLIREWVDVFEADDAGYGGGSITNYDSRYPEFGCRLGRSDRWALPGKTVPRGFIQGSNMAFRLECLKNIGKFDERLGAGTPYAGEDWDMSIRASIQGWKGRYAPKPCVQHDHRRTWKMAEERTAYYEFGAGVVYAKYLFTILGFRMLYRFFDEIITLRSDGVRSKNLLKGFVHYFVKFPKGVS